MSWLTRAMFARRLASVSSRSEEHTSELQSRSDLVCRLLLEKKKKCVVKLPPGDQLCFGLWMRVTMMLSGFHLFLVVLVLLDLSLGGTVSIYTLSARACIIYT